MNKNGHSTLSEKIDSTVVCQTSQGTELRGTVVRLTRHLVVFEFYSLDVALRMSEVLSPLKIEINSKLAYSGKAVVSNLVNTGALVVCEAQLAEPWLGADSLDGVTDPVNLQAGFEQFVSQWQKFYKIMPEYKRIVADIQTFLTDMRLWLGQVELNIRSGNAADAPKRERDAAYALEKSTTPAITALFEKFELAALEIDPDLRPAHGAFVKRQLHPLLLSSPFLFRTFQKPLGYAGDYEMVNMIMRDPCEGNSLFAKILNLWFLAQPPAEAHRNRIQYLTDRITEATIKARAAGRTARILSLGCGPAGEVQQFLREKHFSDQAHFTLLDFNEETLAHTRATLDQLKNDQHRKTSVEFVKKSVVQIFKEAERKNVPSPEQPYDFVYCAGLFDYLSDAFCQRLTNILYDWVAPGGLLVTTNVDDSNPRRLTMEYVMEWNLIYRNGAQLAAVKPERVGNGECTVKSDTTGVNIYFEAEKPKHA
ncbi:MAG: Methyltransferase domain family [Pedosphaera sp.]|nr:Methyltransferase domain family [Pedosphaera sp.]